MSLNGEMMSVAVSEQPTFRAETPKLLFRRDYMLQEFEGRSYDVNADGSRFLMVKRRLDDLTSLSSLTAVENWFDDLTRLAPAK